MPDKKISSSSSINKSIKTANDLMNKLNMNVYNQNDTKDIDQLNDKFNNILKTEISKINNKDNEDTTSFLGQLFNNEKRTNSVDQVLKKQFNNLSLDEDQAIIHTLIDEAYRNKILKQSDIHEIASQLIELSEAIDTMRDAIISPDVTEGRINRLINFKSDGNDFNADYIPIVENMEKRFELPEKIKSFITPKTLEYGEYYAYIMPYSKIFNDFMANKKDIKYGRMYSESVTDNLTDGKDLDAFCESVYDEWKEHITDDDINNLKCENKNEKTYKKEFINDLKNIMENVSICNDPIPLPVLEEGFDSVSEFRNSFVNESGDQFVSEGFGMGKDIAKTTSSVFAQVNSDSSNGIHMEHRKKEKNEFKDIKDCYFKLVDPTRMLELTIMDECIGYYYVLEEDITPVAGIMSSTLYFDKFNSNRREQNIITSIAERIVEKFDKKFLNKNPKFKKLIVNAIEYYNLNEKRIKFQFVPKEYVVHFKVNKDVDGNGVSMLQKSLFYAKLYLMLLLFKIMSIILYSNDQKVNYLRTSGIDANLINKVQEIARQKQSRNIHLMDLFSYTTLINKIGNGTEMYIPVGKGGERPIETEILSGQDIQLNNELMEKLYNSYILGTGVPSAIMNYLNEADFAKSIENANTKMNGRIINYQLDFNPAITEMYKKLMLWSTNIPADVIDTFTFVFPAPKSSANTAKQELVNNFDTTANFLTGLLFDENDENNKLHKMLFRRELAKEFLPMFDYDKIDEIYKQTLIDSKLKNLDPLDKSEDDENNLDDEDLDF